MKLNLFKLGVILCCTTLLQACMASLPKLEGGQLKLASPNLENTSSDKQKELLALEELSKIDLYRELDPNNLGTCHKEESPSDKKPSFDTLTEPEKLACALNGFYAYENYEKLGADDKKGLEVSNVAFAYAKKQASRIAELAKSFDDTDGAYGDYYKSTRKDVQEKIIKIQIEDLATRVKSAQSNSAFLEFQRRNRNRVQSRLLSSSDAACDLYKRELNGIYSNSNFVFGSVATVAGGLGAIATGPTASRSFSGLSGITSGTRAEFNDAYFRNKVVELLTKAMDISRDRKREEIKRRGVQIIADYSMEDAIDDAILYNSQCSLVAGLQETSDSLKIVSDPGLKWLANAFGGAGAVSESNLTSALFQSMGAAVSTIQQIQKSTEDQNTIIDMPNTQPSDDKAKAPPLGGGSSQPVLKPPRR